MGASELGGGSEGSSGPEALGWSQGDRDSPGNSTAVLSRSPPRGEKVSDKATDSIRAVAWGDDSARGESASESASDPIRAIDCSKGPKCTSLPSAGAGASLLSRQGDARASSAIDCSRGPKDESSMSGSGGVRKPSLVCTAHVRASDSSDIGVWQRDADFGLPKLKETDRMDRGGDEASEAAGELRPDGTGRNRSAGSNSAGGNVRRMLGELAQCRGLRCAGTSDLRRHEGEREGRSEMNRGEPSGDPASEPPAEPAGEADVPGLLDPVPNSVGWYEIEADRTLRNVPALLARPRGLGRICGTFGSTWGFDGEGVARTEERPRVFPTADGKPGDAGARRLGHGDGDTEWPTLRVQ